MMGIYTDTSTDARQNSNGAIGEQRTWPKEFKNGEAVSLSLIDTLKKLLLAGDRHAELPCLLEF